MTLISESGADHRFLEALLLADPSVCLRYRVLRDLFDRSEDDPEVTELADFREADPLTVSLLKLQDPNGSWKTGVLGDPFGGGVLQATGLALTRLAFLGFDRRHPAVQRGAEYLFSQQLEDGAWPLVRSGGGRLMPQGDQVAEGEGEEGYSMMPLQTVFPLRGLAASGWATDPRCERAYEWLLAQRLPDGAWPTGIAAGGVYGYVAGYRHLAHSRWGCRSNTTGALACLSLHPTRRTGPEARRALDLLLGRETRERQPLGLETARLVGAERARGFITFFARYDLAFVLQLCWQVGATLEDARVAEMAGFVLQQQGHFGIWEYQPAPQASRWVTFELLTSLAGLEANSQNPSEWLSLEPRTPFQAYAKLTKRY